MFTGIIRLLPAKKAYDQISMGVARLAVVEPPRIRIGQIVKKALVVGCSLEGFSGGPFPG